MKGLGCYGWSPFVCRTKFVSDDWMVDHGFMESAVAEEDKW